MVALLIALLYATCALATKDQAAFLHQFECNTLVTKLLKDHDIKRFHASLSNEEATTFQSMLSDAVAIHIKLQDQHTSIIDQQESETIIDQSLENESAEFSYRYHNLLQKIAHYPHLASKLMMHIEYYLQDLLYA